MYEEKKKTNSIITFFVNSLPKNDLTDWERGEGIPRDALSTHTAFLSPSTAHVQPMLLT